MATTSQSPAAGADLLEFCLQSWTDHYQNSAEEISDRDIDTAGKVAAVLASEKRFLSLDRFVCGIPSHVLSLFLKNEQFRPAVIALRCYQERHEDVCKLIENGTFSDGSDLIETWDMANYALWEQQFRKPLSALIRFRIRKRNPPPPSICRGGRPTRNLGSQAKSVLTSWLSVHRDCPYPNQADRDQIREATGLTHTQIKTWFANARRRSHPKKASTGGMLEQKDHVDKPHQYPKATDYLLQQGRPQYLQPPPASPASCDCTGLHGLMRMYNRLAAQGATTGPVTSPLPPDHFLHNNHNNNNNNPPHPSPSGILRSPHLFRCSPGRHCSPAQHPEMTGPLLQTQTAECSELGPRSSAASCSVLSPVLMFSPTWRTSTSCGHNNDDDGQSWSGLGSPLQAAWQQLECSAGQLQAVSPLLVQSAERVPPRLPARKRVAVSTETFTSMPPSVLSPSPARKQVAVTRETFTPKPSSVLSPLAQSAQRRQLATMTTDTLTAVPSSVLSQCQMTDLRVVSVPVERPAAPHPHPHQSPVFVGGVDHVTGDGHGCLLRDQCLAMWNASSWFTAAQSPPMHSPLLSPGLESAESCVAAAADMLLSDSCLSQTQTDGISALATTIGGDPLLPSAPLDTVFLLQPLTPKSATSIAAQTYDIAEEIFSPHSVVIESSTEDMDDEAAQILLDLSTSTTSKSSPL